MAEDDHLSHHIESTEHSWHLSGRNMTTQGESQRDVNLVLPLHSRVQTTRIRHFQPPQNYTPKTFHAPLAGVYEQVTLPWLTSVLPDAKHIQNPCLTNHKIAIQWHELSLLDR